MAKIYIQQNTVIKPAIIYNDGLTLAKNGIGDNFNSSNCLSTVTYYVTVDGNLAGSFTLNKDTVNFIIGDDFSSGMEEGDIILPSVGSLTLEPFDFDACGSSSGWYWHGENPAVISVYYEKETRYFNNDTLNTLWTNLVNNVQNLCKEWQVFLMDDEDDSQYIWIDQSNNTLNMDGDPGWFKNLTTGARVESYSVENNHRYIPLDNLDKNCIYQTFNGATDPAYITAILVSSEIPLQNTKVSGIHDALIKHFNLVRDNPPISSGDYMKGISIASNYYTNDNQMDLSSINTLERIVDRLSHSCQLSEDMVLTLNGRADETGFTLYDAETGERLALTGAVGDNVFDLTDYYDDFQYKKQYYAVAEWMVYDYSDEDSTDFVYYYIRSNVVTCAIKQYEDW